MKFEVQQLVGHLDDPEVVAKWQREIDEINKWHTIQGGPFGIIKGEVKECYIKPFNNSTGCGLWVRKFDGNLLLYLYHWWLKLKMGWYRGYTVSPFNLDKYAPLKQGVFFFFAGSTRHIMKKILLMAKLRACYRMGDSICQITNVSKEV